MHNWIESAMFFIQLFHFASFDPVIIRNLSFDSCIGGSSIIHLRLPKISPSKLLSPKSNAEPCDGHLLYSPAFELWLVWNKNFQQLLLLFCLWSPLHALHNYCLVPINGCSWFSCQLVRPLLCSATQPYKMIRLSSKYYCLFLLSLVIINYYLLFFLGRNSDSLSSE